MKKKDISKKRKIVFLEGDRIMLRPLCERDINRKYLSWINDKEITKYMATGTFPTTFKELRSFYDKIAKSKTDVMFVILDKKHNLHIGNIKLGNINWVHRFADLGIMIGEKKYWGKGYGQEACRLGLGYAFDKLNLNKIILGVYASHKPAIKTYQKVGFKIEGRIKKLLNFEGNYVDKLIMGVSRSEFKKYKNERQ